MEGALIASVIADSPAYDAGFEAGCRITHVDGSPLRDILDWRWLSDGDEIEVSYIDLDSEEGSVVLEREPGEDWGFEFSGAVFDGVKTCKNSCTFCFMRQLPQGMRKSLSMRDDDFRLSFLQGTFVTLTNLSDEDAKRIVEQRISPLRVSLHAVDPDVRRRIIGKNAERGLQNLELLLDEGIEFDAQVVLVPGQNDGDVLDETLEWAYSHPGIRNIGIVPLGFTRFQDRFDASFDAPEDSLRVISQIGRFQERALSERGNPWAYAADEFYSNAYADRILEMLPDASFYGDFGMFEDGIGIIRSVVDEFRDAVDSGLAARAAKVLRKKGLSTTLLTGEAMHPHIGLLLKESPLDGLLFAHPVPNGFFGGNVNVTGLLTGSDLVDAIRGIEACREGKEGMLYLIPDIVFNADGVTLDDMSKDGIGSLLEADVARRVHVVASNPLDYMVEIERIAKQA